MESSTSHEQPDRGSGPVGLIAGWGRYPVIIAEALRLQGRLVYCLGVSGHADPALADICDDFRWNGLGRFGRAIRYFSRHGVREATMAGKIHKHLLFRPGLAIRHVPDWTTFRAFFPFFLSRRKACRDDTLLTRIVALFASAGVRLGPATDYAPELLVSAGQLTRRGPSPGESKDIRFGWQVAKELGRFDCGQSVAVKNETVLALEAVEGTDACIRRAGELCSSGGFTLVKVAKPQQDMRFDVPTVGLGTLETLRAAGGRVLAVEAERTIFLDQPEVIQYADRHGMTIVALEGPDETASVS